MVRQQATAVGTELPLSVAGLAAGVCVVQLQLGAQRLRSLLTVLPLRPSARLPGC